MRTPVFLFLLLILAMLAGCSGTAVETAALVGEPLAPETGETIDQATPIEDMADSDGADASQDVDAPPDNAESEGNSSAKTEPQTSPQEISYSWEGLSFDQFLDESWNSVMRRDPELLTELGISEAFGMGNDQLTDISDAYLRQTYALYTQILDHLNDYDRDSLTPEQQLNYDIYAFYLEDTLDGEAFIGYDYPITHFITGVQYQLINFFTDIHPVKNLQNAQDYITRLSQVDTKFEQVIANMQLSEGAGVITPRMILQWSMGDIRGIANSSPRNTPFYTSFAEKVNDLDDLSADQKTVLLEAAETEIESSVIPAFGALADYLGDLQSRAPARMVFGSTLMGKLTTNTGWRVIPPPT